MALSFLRHGLGIAIGLAVLTACGQPGLPSGSPPQDSASGAARARSALLYVAHEGTTGNGKDVALTIATFPQIKQVAKIDLHYRYTRGICSDAMGNVWVLAANNLSSYAVEFAHGGTKSIGRVKMPDRLFGNGCAVDPSTGDLAVMSTAGTYQGSLEIWHSPYQARPASYAVPFEAENGVYDDSGNLYIDGVRGGSDFWLEAAELPQGSASVTPITLDKRGASAGGIQWDGAYVAMATGTVQGYQPRIYRVQVSGSNGHVVSSIKTKKMSLTSQIFLDGDTVVGAAFSAGSERLATWRYPHGGKPSLLVDRFGYITGIAISK